jgi:hypothetical protein
MLRLPSPATPRRALALGLTLSGVLTLGAALAQEPGDGDEAEQVDGETGTVRRAQLTPEEQLSAAREVSERGEQLSRRVLAMLDEARRERDIIRVTCLNDKLTQINAHRRSLDTRVSALEDAVEQGNESRRNHEYTVVTVLDQQFQVLDQESNQCVGQDIFDTGTTRVITDIDPSTPTADPADYPEPAIASVPFIPPPASGDS